MAKNVTLKLDESILRKARHAATEEDRSLSEWVTLQIIKAVSGKENFDAARKRAFKRLKRGFRLGGTPFSRDEIYGR
jgi:hypothetical protein